MSAFDTAGTVLVVDDEPGSRALLSRFLQRDGYRVELAADGEAALAALGECRPDIILLDVMLPGLDGFDVCRRIKADPTTRLTPVVMLTGLEDSARLEGIVAGADDFLSKPFNAGELAARVASLVRMKRYTDELETAESVIMSLAHIVEARDPYTGGHCHRLAAYSVALGEQIGLAAEQISAVRRGGHLHDVGKIAVPDSVLLKPEPLSPEEYELLKRHTIIGDELCGDLRSLGAVRPIIRHHHERLDGSGYPDGLAGDAIPITAQIVAVADTYDAITTNRPYRAALPMSHAFNELAGDVRHGRMCRDLVDAFVALGGDGSLQRIALDSHLGDRACQERSRDAA